MTNYFHIESDGTKRGPFTEQQIRELAKWGHINPDTPIEPDTGSATVAGQIPGLEFGQQPAWSLSNNQFASASKTMFASTTVCKHNGISTGFFDIGFTRFITNTWTSILWLLTIFLTFIGCGGAMVFGASNGAPALLFIAPIVAVVFLLIMRMSFELTIVLFRIETHLREIKENSKKV